MTVLAVDNLEKSYGIETIFERVSFTLGWGQRLGLLGRNGAGKTTLLRILTGALEADRGSVKFAKGVRPGYLKQEDVVDPEHTVLQEAEEAFDWVRRMETRLAELTHTISDAAHAGHAHLEAAAMEEYGQLRDRFEIMGGYDQLRDVPGVLKKLGFSQEDQAKRCGSLSGGEKTRLAIARLLLSGPDVLLLDEPTNHLDIDATEWLESFLRGFGGALVLVSHDRTFLDRVVTNVAELERGRITVYQGNVTQFLRQKAEREERQAELHAREQAEVERLLTFWEKWKNTPTKKNQAWSRYKWAERIKATMTDAPVSGQKSAKMSLKSGLASGREVLIVERLAKRYGDRTLFENLSFMIERGERVGVVGPNGAGKSTLIKLVMGREEPSYGQVRLGHNVTTGYFAQDVADLDLDRSVIENMLDMGGQAAEEARTFLGRFLFTGEDVFRPVRSLSGGEKNKLSLAQITYMQPNLLILDEPTNHLDLESREALGKMLIGYDGALILVSHDRYLLDQVTGRTIEVKDGNARVFEMAYGEYRLKSAAAGSGRPLAPINGGTGGRGGAGSSRAKSREQVVSKGPSGRPLAPINGGTGGSDGAGSSRAKSREHVVSEGPSGRPLAPINGGTRGRGEAGSSRAQSREHVVSEGLTHPAASPSSSHDEKGRLIGAVGLVEEELPRPDLARLQGLNFHQLSKERQRARGRLEGAEARVAALEAEMAEIVEGLSRPSDEAISLAKRHGEVQGALEEAIGAWESAQVYLDLAMGV